MKVTDEQIATLKNLSKSPALHPHEVEAFRVAIEALSHAAGQEAVAQVLEIYKAEDEDAWFGRVEFTEPLKVGDLLYTHPRTCPSGEVERDATVPALEVFRIAGGDVECSPNPTAEEALECLRDLRSSYDEVNEPDWNHGWHE